MSRKKYSMVITEDERNWFHEIAKEERKSIPFMIIECFRKKSEKLGIPLPNNIISNIKRLYRESDHTSLHREFSFKKLMEETPQLNFI